MCTFVCVCVCEPQEGNEVDKYNLNHPKLIHRPFMTLYIMVVGKFYDNFHDLPAQQNHFNLYKNDDEDDPVAWAPAATATSTKTMPKVCFTFFLSLKSSWLHFDFLMNLLGCHNSIFKIDLMYYIVQPKLVVSFHFLSFFAVWRLKQPLTLPTNHRLYYTKVENCWWNRISKNCPSYLLAISRKFYELDIKYHGWNIICQTVRMYVCIRAIDRDDCWPQQQNGFR